MKSSETEVMVIGASAAGLACAACLKSNGIDYEIIEKHDKVGHAWRNHYDRLHLHTPKSSSALPGLKFPRSIPKYPARNQVVEYLERYCTEMGISPHFNTEAQKIHKDKGVWSVQTSNRTFTSNYVVVASGNTNEPNRISKKGLDSFTGQIVHSSEYKNGGIFRGKKVLVIGFGNSACEIAICLHEHGAKPFMSVKSPVNVIPRDILGFSVLQIGTLTDALPPRIADAINKPILDLLIGDITKFGLKKLPYGPKEQISRDHRIPLLDIGTLELIRKGEVIIFPDIEKIEGSNIFFVDGRSKDFDAIIMATGYKTALDKFIELEGERLQDIQKPVKKRNLFGKDRLYFCGFYVSPNGMLREMGIEAKTIARDIKVKKEYSH